MSRLSNLHTRSLDVVGEITKRKASKNLGNREGRIRGSMADEVRGFAAAWVVRGAAQVRRVRVRLGDEQVLFGRARL